MAIVDCVVFFAPKSPGGIGWHDNHGCHYNLQSLAKERTHPGRRLSKELPNPKQSGLELGLRAKARNKKQSFARMDDRKLPNHGHNSMTRRPQGLNRVAVQIINLS